MSNEEMERYISAGGGGGGVVIAAKQMGDEIYVYKLSLISQDIKLGFYYLFFSTGKYYTSKP